MWAIIAILGLVLFLICIPAFVYALKKKKKGGIAVYAVMAGIGYCILLFGGLEAVSEHKAAQASEAKHTTGEAVEETKPTQSASKLSGAAKPAGIAEKSAEKKAELESREAEPENSPNMPDEIISDEIPDEVEPAGESSSLPEQLTASGGIGDTLSVLEDEFGYNSGDEKQASFKRGAVIAALHPPTKRAYKIEYGFVGDVAGALSAISDMIPADSVQLDMRVGNDKVMISYRSEMLSQGIQQSDFVASFNVSKVGNDKLASYISISPGTFTSTKGTE
ncbi:hypothetical protein DFP94_103416 [Fontibacillus phaseoli]|uniref:Uncharacterized protein n=1 Tax=Fontibacillus phaseoli TaxID=1416533 RepID=A0A369BLW2_9BACL|nr:hypothetical protein [Fontibacillus phaseoli]RCX20684.1 hypothetical protein DFP94_103416 [Fontibacillus phaseoli]